MNDKSGLHIWVIKDQIEDFREAKNKVRFESSPFMVADAKWQLVCYPNGSKFENLGSVMVFLRLLQFPPYMKSGGILTVTFRLQCQETKSSSTFIETYNHSNDSKGWQSRNVLLSELIRESIKKVTFQCDLKLLKILNSDHKITYESPLKIYKDKFTLTWKLTDDLMDRFQFAHNGQWFESQNYSNLWCFKCAPNGYNVGNDGCCILFVQICGLPPNISRMKCKIKLFCEETNTKWTIKKEFGYDAKNCGWTKGKLDFKKLLKCDKVTFRAEIDILGLYDLYGNKTTVLGDHAPNSQYALPNEQYNNGNTNGGSVAGYGGSNQRPSGQGRRRAESKTDDNDYENIDMNDLQLDSMEQLQRHIRLLTKKMNKMSKTLNSVKAKSRKNDDEIKILRNEIQQIQNGSYPVQSSSGGGGSTLSDGGGGKRSKAFSVGAVPAQNGNRVADDILDMFTITEAPEETIQVNNNTNANANDVTGWETF